MKDNERPSLWYTFNDQEVFLADFNDMPSDINPLGWAGNIGAYPIEEWKHYNGEYGCCTYLENYVGIYSKPGEEVVSMEILNPENGQTTVDAWVLRRDVYNELVALADSGDDIALMELENYGFDFDAVYNLQVNINYDCNNPEEVFTVVGFGNDKNFADADDCLRDTYEVNEDEEHNVTRYKSTLAELVRDNPFRICYDMQSILDNPSFPVDIRSAAYLWLRCKSLIEQNEDYLTNLYD